MLDYITKHRRLSDDAIGSGYVIAVPTRWGSYRSAYNDNPRGYNLGVENRSRSFYTVWADTADGARYRAGFIIYVDLDEAMKAWTSEHQRILKVDYRGRICHGMYNGHRVTIAKYRTLIETV